MTKQTEALKLALEALQNVYLGERNEAHYNAITALRTAIAEAEQEQKQKEQKDGTA